MIIGPRRLALIGVAAAIGLVIVFYPLIVKTDIDLSKIDIRLDKVEVVPSNQTDQTVTVKPTFTITNTNDITLTTESIDYQLYANGKSVGSGTISYADVPVIGRPEMFSNTTVKIPGSFDVQLSSDNADIFKQIRSNSTQVTWSATGTASIESGTTIAPKDFTATKQK